MSRIIAVALAVTPILPWYSYQARIEGDTYIGNPLPLVDWLVAAVAVAAAIRVGLATVAALSALVSVGLTLLLAYGDAAEGLSVTLDYGLVVTAVLAGLLLRDGFGKGMTALSRSVLAAIRRKPT